VFYLASAVSGVLKPGAISICFKCGHVARFGPNLEIVEMPEAERNEVLSWPPVALAVSHIKIRMAQMKARDN
jgi:hypothetical protein